MRVRFPACALFALFILGYSAAFAAEKAQTQPQSQPQTQPQTEVTVVHDVLLKGTYSGFKEPLQKVIQTKQEFDDLWKKHVSVLVPQPPAPDVDFETSVIVAIYYGEKNTSGFQILLKNVEAKGNDVVVHYRLTEPPPNSFTLQVLTQPFLLLRVEKPKGQVTLLKE